jgi:hypothetical protein
MVYSFPVALMAINSASSPSYAMAGSWIERKKLRMQDKNLHVVGRAGGSPESFRGCCAAQEFRAERQLCPTRKARIFVMRPKIEHGHEMGCCSRLACGSI